MVTSTCYVNDLTQRVIVILKMTSSEIWNWNDCVIVQDSEIVNLQDCVELIHEKDCVIVSRMDCVMASQMDCVIASRMDCVIASRMDCVIVSQMGCGNGIQKDCGNGSQMDYVKSQPRQIVIWNLPSSYWPLAHSHYQKI